MHPSPSPKFRWDVLAVFVGTSLVALTLVPLYGILHGYNPMLWLGFVVFLIWNSMSITAGYHRLWAHQSYSAHGLVRFMFALGGALSIQNSIRQWCSNHRNHHRYTDDNERDPYSARRGLWFSHLGWMLRDHPAAEVDFENIPDLDRDPVVVWQHRHYWTLVPLVNVGLPLLYGFAAGDMWGGLLLLGFLRLVVCHHTTFFINSLAHIWGKQPYSDEVTARDNTVVALLTYGEGYHNFHHTFQWDYRNGIRWYHFDPTKWLIRGLSYLRLTRDLKVAAPEKIEKALARMQLKAALEKVSRFQSVNTQKWLELLDSEYNQLVDTINEWSTCRQEWLALQKASLQARWDATELALRLKQLEQELEMQRRQWRTLTQQFA